MLRSRKEKSAAQKGIRREPPSDTAIREGPPEHVIISESLKDENEWPPGEKGEGIPGRGTGEAQRWKAWG